MTKTIPASVERQREHAPVSLRNAAIQRPNPNNEIHLDREVSGRIGFSYSVEDPLAWLKEGVEDRES
jgi:hypothetical protein